MKMNLVEGLSREIARVAVLVDHCKQVNYKRGVPMLDPIVRAMEAILEAAHQAQGSGNSERMIAVARALREWQ